MAVRYTPFHLPIETLGEDESAGAYVADCSEGVSYRIIDQP